MKPRQPVGVWRSRPTLNARHGAKSGRPLRRKSKMECDLEDERSSHLKGSHQESFFLCEDDRTRAVR